MLDLRSRMQVVSRTLGFHSCSPPAHRRNQLVPDYMEDKDILGALGVEKPSSLSRFIASKSSLEALRPLTMRSTGVASKWTSRPGSSTSSKLSTKSKSLNCDKQVTICESNNTNALAVNGEIFEFAATSEV
mmetsp:Transcript_9854/g.22419  ORF Transcript_9854/g.22419 Transcript_9854/m.22419 type:complete len:131 (+) Transcript_9854:63-455(+)